MEKANNRKTFYGALEFTYRSLAAALRMELEKKVQRFTDYAMRMAQHELERSDSAFAAAKRPNRWLLDSSLAHTHYEGTKKHIALLRGITLGENSDHSRAIVLKATQFVEYMAEREVLMGKKTKARPRNA
ncbi:MAG: hypothetical protein A2806_01570 [Candidatus Terrybacteria bacterium RIFCSPHIGHO2_01_FULL_48_17]|uniref:Uncharacterized protein n=1 Tax=Candidatus Terrybacteria bacterium RIFCSPHIGHO2_01_FULL_48_17 TaxID=1802362 RepID=A0A1G2PL66_9BACT|nr:MAG: hypothetical protein A2806_01570 [Candidatus Terrybacteria bacterium RIFCSPHIGHO2_01_FULL_48_17]OHA52702.1 MAG: hypothetical protein A3A30_03735 [Candidatus Terrybacteria bacterium RIFCSPLOWO2_01_FULL_48_14]